LYGAFRSSFAGSNGVVYVGSGKFDALNARTGAKLWKWSNTHPVETGILISSDCSGVDSCPSQGDTGMLPVGESRQARMGNLPSPIGHSINGSSTTHANSHQRNLK
jgi:outer membrane protein assembly factor BamB